MRRVDEPPIGPEVRTSLDAVDATLAGEAVDPKHAELAELALLLASDRPQIPTSAADALDAKVARRFAPPTKSRSRRRWLFAPAAMVALTAVVAVVVVVSPGGPGSVSGSSTSAATPALRANSSGAGASTPPTPATPSTGGGAESASAGSTAAPSASGGTGSSSAGQTAAAPSAGTGAAPSAGQTAAAPASGAGAAPAPQPPANGHKIIQSANLNLAVSPNRIDQVAQEVFDVIGAQKGIVNHSTVTATGGSDGYAEFQLSVPSSTLSQTMTELSQLRGANVLSRTDATQDINGQFVSTSRRLADARALRTALLKQLADATTTTQIDSLRAQIRDAEASIASDQATLRRLNQQVNYSEITLTMNARVVPVAASSGDSFTIGRAAHDAGRVLTVAAGVGLIVLAALVPIGLVGAVAWWLAASIRRRRREQALDLA